MIAFQLQNITVEFGDHRVLDQITAQCAQGAVIGLIGANGAGKSTLFKVIEGSLSPTAGERTVLPGQRIGYLRQDSGLCGTRTVLEELRGVAAEGLEAIERLPAVTDPREYQRLEALIAATDAYQIDVRIRTVLNGMGFAGRDLSVKTECLSGGERTRVALCKLLIEEPNLLLLDEPTNHLDFRTLHWLEEYIRAYKGTVLVVSHDRFFLDRVADEIWELEAGKLRAFHGNYTAYKEQKALWIKERERLFERQEEEVARLTDYIDRNLVRASTSAMAKSRRKQLEKMERIERPREKPREMHLQFSFDRAGGNDVLQCRDLAVTVGADHRLFSGVALETHKGEKIAIVGDNGVGKSTLLSVLIGDLLPESGRIRWGAQITRGFFHQEMRFLNDDHTVLQELGDRFPRLTNQELRSILARVSFFEEDTGLRVGNLSGGERARFQFVILMLERANTLLLDEPTNHLDLPAREEVERALSAFAGNLLIVSHDRYFLSHVPDRVYKLTRDGLRELKRLEDYWESAPLPAPEPPEKKKAAAVAGYRNKEERAAEARRRQKLSSLERRLAETEAEIAALEEKLTAGGDYKDLARWCADLDALKARQDQLTEEWLKEEEES